jgi:hypothetical protein
VRQRYQVRFSNGVETCVRTSDRHFELRQYGRVLVEGSDVFLPLSWREQECIAFSRCGGARVWTLPPEWSEVSHVEVRPLFIASESTDSLDEVMVLPVLAESRIRLSLQALQAVVVTPAQPN